MIVAGQAHVPGPDVISAQRFHVRGDYRYTVINGQPVLVERGTRRVVEVID